MLLISHLVIKITTNYLKIYDTVSQSVIYPNPSWDIRSGQTFYTVRPHAVCTVQTFRNAQTGPMLYMFVNYYHR